MHSVVGSDIPLPPLTLPSPHPPPLPRPPHTLVLVQEAQNMGTCRIFQLKEVGEGGNSSRWHRVDEGRQRIPSCFGNEFWRDEFKGEYQLVTSREQCDGRRLGRSCKGELTHGNHLSSPCPSQETCTQHRVGVGVLFTESPFPSSLTCHQGGEEWGSWEEGGKTSNP